MDSDKKIEIRRYAVKLRFVDKRHVSYVLPTIKTRFGRCFGEDLAALGEEILEW